MRSPTAAAERVGRVGPTGAVHEDGRAAVGDLERQVQTGLLGDQAGRRAEHHLDRVEVGERAQRREQSRGVVEGVEHDHRRRRVVEPAGRAAAGLR